jgi:hypothetical protein
MKTLLIAALLIGSVGPVAAAPPAGDRHADCPERREHEDGRAYGARARDYCEVRWQGLLAARQTGGRTHDEFVDACLRRCVTDRHAEAGAPLEWIIGGISTATLGCAIAGCGDVGSVTGSGTGVGGHTTPPASP